MIKPLLPPVISVDGPSGSGKGTIALRLAKALGFRMLDSGAIYRAVAWAVIHHKVSLADIEAFRNLLHAIEIFVESENIDKMPTVTCDGQVITEEIRSERCGKVASELAALPLCREWLLPYQWRFRQFPGLVADGRDMGTTVFPDALLKFYFYATAEERATRRFKQLQAKGINASLRDIREDLSERDTRDAERPVSPTRPAADAILVDTTGMDIESVFQRVMEHVEARGVRTL